MNAAMLSQTAETPQEILNSETSSLGMRRRSIALAGQQIITGGASEVPIAQVTRQEHVVFVNKHAKNLSKEKSKMVRKFSKITLPVNDVIA